MRATITIQEVKEVRGFIHPKSVYAGDPNRYSSINVRSQYQPKALKIKALMNESEVEFYTPSVIVTVNTGMLNYQSMPENPWFQIFEEPIKGYKGSTLFDDGRTLNTAIQHKSTISPKVMSGDVLTISFLEKEGKIKNVRVIEKK